MILLQKLKENIKKDTVTHFLCGFENDISTFKTGIKSGDRYFEQKQKTSPQFLSYSHDF